MPVLLRSRSSGGDKISVGPAKGLIESFNGGLQQPGGDGKIE